MATEHAGHGEELAYSIASSTKNALIVSSSGDGGYGDVINGIMRAKNEGHTAVASVLPAGNANDHYNNLHDGDIVERIRNGKTAHIDLLKITSTVDTKPFTRYAHSYIGFGLTPAVGLELNKTKLTILNEGWIVAKSLIAVKPVKLKIDEKVRAYESVIFSNVDVMSKYLKISRPSSMNDGKFEVTIFRRRNKLKLLLLLLEASFKGVVENKSVPSFTLHTVKRTLVQTDGEITTLDADALATITAERETLECVV